MENGLSLPEDLSAHTLRHSFCTRMCENGVNVKVTQALMGHAKVSTTLDIYTDTFEDTIRDSVSDGGFPGLLTPLERKEDTLGSLALSSCLFPDKESEMR